MPGNQGKKFHAFVHSVTKNALSHPTMTGDVESDGSSRYNMYVCMYVYVRQALGPITPRACVAGAESAIFEIYFYRERKLWKKKRSLAQEWTRTWV